MGIGNEPDEKRTVTTPITTKYAVWTETAKELLIKPDSQIDTFDD
jgi:hypothetical protein